MSSSPHHACRSSHRTCPQRTKAASVLCALEATQLELTQVGEFEAGTGKEVSHGAGHEHLAGLGAIQDSGRRMDGDAAHVVALELDLAGVDAGAGGEPLRRGCVEHPGSASYRAGRAVEHHEEPVAGRLDLPAAETLDLLPRGLVVLGQKRAPATVSHAGQRLGRRGEIGEDDGGERSLRDFRRRLRKQPAAGEVDGDPRLIADDPRVVAGRHLEHVALDQLGAGAFVHLNAERAGHHVAGVVDLTGGRPHDRLDVLGPAPARLEDGAADDGLAQVDELDARLLDRPDFIGLVEALATQLHSAILRDA